MGWHEQAPNAFFLDVALLSPCFLPTAPSPLATTSSSGRWTLCCRRWTLYLKETHDIGGWLVPSQLVHSPRMNIDTTPRSLTGRRRVAAGQD